MHKAQNISPISAWFFWRVRCIVLLGEDIYESQILREKIKPNIYLLTKKANSCFLCIAKKISWNWVYILSCVYYDVGRYIVQVHIESGNMSSDISGKFSHLQIISDSFIYDNFQACSYKNKLFCRNNTALKLQTNHITIVIFCM